MRRPFRVHVRVHLRPFWANADAFARSHSSAPFAHTPRLISMAKQTFSMRNILIFFNYDRSVFLRANYFAKTRFPSHVEILYFFLLCATPIDIILERNNNGCLHHQIPTILRHCNFVLTPKIEKIE